MIIKLMELLDNRTIAEVSGDIVGAAKAEKELKQLYNENKEDIIALCPQIENETNEIKAVSICIKQILEQSK